MWELLLTCLCSRAVHVEIMPSLDTVSFINAFKRFVSIRGPCKIIRSDRGSNVVRASNQKLQSDLDAVNVGSNDSKYKWIFNPPLASHYEGV